jgi:threonine aldolase
MINLISDTVTRPSKDMLSFMMKAEVGDDVFGEDPTVNSLQDRVANMFGKEAALFCPSGTMTNQIAIKLHTSPLDEIICDIDSHVYQSETGGYAFHSGVSVHLIQGHFGKITANQIESAIKPGYDWQPISRLAVIENTCNKGGGSYYNLEEIKPIMQLCRERQLRLHLDGARIFNALTETGESCLDWGACFDTLSVCMSKGLGAPVGSLLIGSREHIKQARRLRKVMGGGMRQAGYLAAACHYALDHNISKLKQDHLHAKQIGVVLEKLPFVKSLKPIHTNIIIFELQDDIKDHDILELLRKNGILAAPFGGNTIRFVLHLDITPPMVDEVCKKLKSLKSL